MRWQNDWRKGARQANDTKGGRSRAKFFGATLFLLAGALALVAGMSAAAPEVSITSPAEGATINSGTVPLELSIANFTLNANAVGGANVADEGHFHIMLDGQYKKFDAATTSFLNGVSEGAHTIRIELANNNHSLLGINASVNITIASGAPRLTIVSPATTASWGSSSAELQIMWENFTTNAGAIGSAAVQGEGHYHVYVNGAYFYYGTTSFFNATYLTIGGQNTVRVELANNDHTLLSDRAFDEIRLGVPAGVPEVKIDPALFQANVNSSSLVASLTISNFTLDPAAIGSAAVAGTGHYHAWIDGAFLGPSTGDGIKLLHLGPGQHTLVVELRNNDHSRLSPAVVDWEVFTVLPGAPDVSIDSPAGGASFIYDFVQVDLSVSNFEIIGDSGAPNAPGQGHYHVFVDGVLATMVYGDSFVLGGLAEGDHTIRVELANNDHTPRAEAVFDEVKVTTQGKHPTISIASPAAGAGFYPGDLTVEVAFTNFTLAPGAIGQAAVEGEGHWHIFVDGVQKGNTGASTFTLTGLAPGSHKITVEMRNNDHSLLGAASNASVTVEVAPVPTVQITSPTTGTETTERTITVTVSLGNFTLDAMEGSPANIIGHGHLHIYVDGNITNMVSVTSFTVANLSVGTHVIGVGLSGTDHVDLDFVQISEVTVVVKEAEPPAPSGGFLPGFELIGVLAAVGVVLVALRSADATRRRR